MADPARRAGASWWISLCLAAPGSALIYTFPKTGSTTVERALGRALVPHAKVHFLGTRHEHAVRRARDRGERPAWHLLSERALRSKLADGLPRLRVITLVRDPVATLLSCRFQPPLKPASLTMTATELADDLARKMQAGRNVSAVLGWLEDELGAIMGGDVFATPFDRQTGAARYVFERADILLLKTETLSRHEKTISDFVGRTVRLRQRNVRGETADAERYRAATRALALPEETLDRIYDSRWVRHFYLDDEIERFRARWLDRSPGHGLSDRIRRSV